MQEELCCQKKVASSVLPSSGPLCLQVLGANSNWLEIIYQVHFKDTESFMELGGGRKVRVSLMGTLNRAENQQK